MASSPYKKKKKKEKRLILTLVTSDYCSPCGKKLTHRDKGTEIKTSLRADHGAPDGPAASENRQRSADKQSGDDQQQPANVSCVIRESASNDGAKNTNNQTLQAYLLLSRPMMRLFSPWQLFKE